MDREPLGNGVVCYVDGAHSFGVDGILLADFSQPGPNDIACDLCTGCGIVPLYWRMSRFPAAAVGVDIDPQAAALFSQGAAESGGGISSVCADLRALEGILPAGGYSLVTANPPYFRWGSGPRGRSAGARFDDTCTLEDVVNAASRLLSAKGRFCLCFRPEGLCGLMQLLRQYSLEPKRLRMAHGRADKAPFLVLLEGKKGARPGLSVLPPLFLKNGTGEDTAEMKEIFSGRRNRK